MARIAGVTTKKNTRGEVTHIIINLKKHNKAIPALKEMGLIAKSQFEKDWERGMSVEEFKQRAIDHVNSLQWDK